MITSQEGKMKIVSNWKAHLKRYSVIMLASLAAIQPVWLAMDEGIKGGLPLWLSAGVNSALAIGGIVGALMKQGILSDGGDHVGE